MYYYSAKTDEEARELLRLFNLPLKKDGQIMARTSVIEREKACKANNRYGARRDALRERMKDMNLTSKSVLKLNLHYKATRNSSKIRCRSLSVNRRPRGVYKNV